MTIEELSAMVLGYLAAVFGWFKWWYELREKNRERVEKEAARKEREIERGEKEKERAEKELERKEKEIERREKEKERTAKERAQQELAAIRRRGDAPFLRPSDRLANHLYHDNRDGKLSYVSFGDKTLLCAMTSEVDMDDGGDLFFLVENLGSCARSVSVKLESTLIALRREAEMHGAHGFYYLVYPYCKAKHGQVQIITLAFETDSGVQDTHFYVTKHGCRVLFRADPALPK